MLNDDRELTDALEAFAKDPSQGLEVVYKAVQDLAIKVVKADAVKGGVRGEDEHLEITHGFMIALMDGKITGFIRTTVDLKREFKRWLAQERAPGGMELWTILSEALRSLEKQGGVVRKSGGSRGGNNSNSTLWCLSDFTDSENLARLDREDFLERAPPVSVKKEGDRLLKPAEARELVQFCLELAEGWCPMGDIHRQVLQLFPGLIRANSLDAPIGEDGKGSRHDVISIENGEDSIALLLDEQVAFSSGRIKQEVSRLKNRDGSLEGGRVLCQYVLKQELPMDKRPTLSQFGNSSTVKDFVDSIYEILARHVRQQLPRGYPPGFRESLRFGVYEKLKIFCSEIGCPLPF